MKPQQLTFIFSAFAIILAAGALLVAIEQVQHPEGGPSLLGGATQQSSAHTPPTTTGNEGRDASPGLADALQRISQLEAELAKLKARPQPTLSESDPADTEASPTDAALSADVDKLIKDSVFSHLSDAMAREKHIAELKKKHEPNLDDLTEVLSLNASQREAMSEMLLKGHRDTYNALNTPMADGRNPWNELVEIVALTKVPARAGEAGPMWGQWLKDVSSQKIPGSDDTYVQRIESIKGEIKSGFERTLSQEQFTNYSSWNLDTNRVKGVPTSPWDDFNRAVEQRVAELGK